MEKITKEFLLEGLDCVNCATKIEKEINKIDGVSAEINFVSKTMVVEFDKSKEKEIVSQIIKNIKRMEPQIDIKTKDSEEEADNNKNFATIMKNHMGKIRFAIAVILLVTALIFSFSQLIKSLLFIISYIIIGGDIVFRAFKNILKGRVFDENFLMTIATIGAIIIGEYAEAVAVMLFYQAGEALQGNAVNRSRKSIAALMEIKPDFANIKINEGYERVSPEHVKVGDIIIVKPGEKVPLDGIIIDGSSFLDCSALTGESMLKSVGSGQNVFSGSINKNGLLKIEVTKNFKESTVSKILDMVQNAANKKAPTEKFITKFARYYTPIVVFIAVLLAVLPPLIIKDALFSDWIYRALVFLVISCPCALVVSIPLGFFGGIGCASKKGILIKGGNYLEALNNVEAVVFDKTGTLTKGEFRVVEIVPIKGFTKEELLEIAALAESFSNHPIARSVLQSYEKTVNQSRIADFEELAGFGVTAEIDGKRVLVGNIKLMRKENIDCNDASSIGSLLHIAIEKEYMGYIVVADEIKNDTIKTIQELKALNIKTIMLTGDKSSVGNHIASVLGIDTVYSELLPNEKVDRIEALAKGKRGNKKIAYIGDGINDAPVISRSDIGIAMGALGSDAAIEAADIVFMTDEPYKIITSIKIAKRTKKIVMQNILLSLGIKAIVLLLGAMGFASMWEAVFADVGVTIIAVLNSMRALKYK